MRNRFFKQDDGYIALKELNSKGRNKRDSTFSTVSTDTTDSALFINPSLRKRMSAAFTKRHSRLPTSTHEWKRASIHCAFTALNAIPIARLRSRGGSRGSSTSHEEEEEDEEEDAQKKKRRGWIMCAATPAPNIDYVYTIRHSALFVPF